MKFTGNLRTPILKNVFFEIRIRRVYSSKQKHYLKFFWRIPVFMEKGWTQSKHFWSKFDALLPPWRWLKFKKISSSGEKRQTLGYPNMSKSRLYLLSPFWEKTRLLFAILRLFLPGNKAGSQFKGLESNLTNPISSTRFLINFL